MMVRQREKPARTTKQRILDEAEKLFAAKGFEGTGIEEIARNVGIRKSVIYYHFGNKEEILQTMLDDFIRRGVAFKKSLFGRYADSFMSKLDEIIEQMVEFMEENRRIVTIVLMESIKSSGYVPLFDLLDLQSPAAREVIASAEVHHIDTVKGFDGDLRGLHEAFFMQSLPMVGYTVFSDQWCKHTGYDKEKSRKTFVDAFLRHFREGTLKRGT